MMMAMGAMPSTYVAALELSDEDLVLRLHDRSDDRRRETDDERGSKSALESVLVHGHQGL